MSEPKTNGKAKLANALDQVSDAMLLAALKRRPHLGGILMTEHVRKQVEGAIRHACNECQVTEEQFWEENSTGRRARAEAMNMLHDNGAGLREIAFGLKTSTTTARRVLQRTHRQPALIGGKQ